MVPEKHPYFFERKKNSLPWYLNALENDTTIVNLVLYISVDNAGYGERPIC